jgi:putative intracellular protease/amidase
MKALIAAITLALSANAAVAKSESQSTQAQSTQAQSTQAPKALLVLSSEGRDGGKTRPGFEMDEFAQAYLVLRANGFAVDAASPAGGAVEADKFNKDDDHIQAMMADANAQRLIANTRRTQDIKPGEYQAIFVMGGKGAMFDLPNDTALTKLLAQQYEQGGIIAAVCHGPAVFANVKLKDGTLLVKGKRVTGFTNEEEESFGKKWVKEYPFLIETKMREQGAQWEEAALMLPKLVIDGRLITGQNPFSTTQAAEAIVKSLGRTPVARTMFKEEQSMQLVTRWLAGEKQAVRAQLDAEPSKYKTDLIGMLGYYHAKTATNEAARRDALSVMLLAEPHMKHPELQVAIAQTQAALGERTAARERLVALVAQEPNFETGKKALAQLTTELASESQNKSRTKAQ